MAVPVTAVSPSTPGTTTARSAPQLGDSALTETGHPGDGRRSEAGFDWADEPLAPGRKRVGFAPAIIGITLPVVLMLIDAITKIVVTDEESRRPQDAWTSSAPRSSRCSSR